MNHYLEISEIFRNYAIILGGFVGIGLAAWRGFVANKQVKINRRGHMFELFTTAVGLLRDNRLEVRPGAIYTLTGVSRDSPEMSEPILELLSAYVRERSL